MTVCVLVSIQYYFFWKFFVYLSSFVVYLSDNDLFIYFINRTYFYFIFIFNIYIYTSYNCSCATFPSEKQFCIVVFPCFVPSFNVLV